MLTSYHVANPQVPDATPLNYTFFLSCGKPSVHACFECNFRNTACGIDFAPAISFINFLYEFA